MFLDVLYSCETIATFSVGRRVESIEAAIGSIKSCRLMFIDHMHHLAQYVYTIHECRLISGILMSYIARVTW